MNVEIVLHGLHSMHIDVIAGQPAFVSPDRRPPGPVAIYPSVTGVAAAEFYSTYGSAENYENGAAGYPVWAYLFYES